MVWICFVQGYYQAKTSQPDLIRPNASVPSLTPVPSRCKWKQALLWNPGHFWGYTWKKALPFGLREYESLKMSEAGFKQMSKRVITAAWERFFLLECCTNLWCQSVKASEVKHLKPMSNIKELGSCRQLGAPVLQDSILQPNTSGTSLFWEQ